MKDVSETERESWLVLRAQSGDQEALSALLESVQGPLFRYIFSLVRERPLAEDILQEVFIRVYRKLKWLEEPQVFRAWAYRIATRETFRHLERERRWVEQVRDEIALKMIPSPPPREEFALELLDRLPQLVADLSPSSRAVIVLYYLHEMSFDEVAVVLQIPVGTVKSRLAYGLASLRQRLKQESSDGRP